MTNPVFCSAFKNQYFIIHICCLVLQQSLVFTHIFEIFLLTVYICVKISITKNICYYNNENEGQFQLFVGILMYFYFLENVYFIFYYLLFTIIRPGGISEIGFFWPFKKTPSGENFFGFNAGIWKYSRFWVPLQKNSRVWLKNEWRNPPPPFNLSHLLISTISGI